MLEFQQLRSFLAVVRAGSFVGGADALGLSKAAVSRHVAELEEVLGVRLLHRTTRRLSLTEAGQLYYNTASRILREAEQMHSQLQHIKRAPAGVLRLTAPVARSVLHRRT